MANIFYLPAFIAIMWELLYGVMSPLKTQRFIKRMKGKKFDDCNSLEKSLVVCMFLYFGWAFIGLLSSQWIIFIALIFISLLCPKKILIVRVIDSIICLAILLFLILNKFHFHIDLWNLLKIKAHF